MFRDKKNFPTAVNINSNFKVHIYIHVMSNEEDLAYKHRPN